MKHVKRLIELADWARKGVVAHPFLSICVIYLVLKQLVVIWSFNEKIQAPPNMFIALGGSALLALPWAFALRGRLRLFALAAIDVAFGILLLLDLIYYRQFADLPSVASLRYAGLATDAGEIVEQLLRPADILLFAGPLLLVGLAFRRNRLLEKGQVGLRRALVLSVVGIGLVAAVTATTSKLKKPFGGHTVVASRLGPLGYHAYDAGTFVARGLQRRFGSIEDEFLAARSFFAERPARATTELTGSLAGKNVIYLQIESWNAFPVGMKVGGQEVTPNFNRLAEESVHFTRMHAQVGQGTTSDAEWTAQCSLYPLRTGSAYYEHATNDLRCLPEILAERGYTTAAFHANRPDFWNRGAMYPTVGVETYYDERSFEHTGDNEIGWGLSDEAFFDQTIDKLQQMPEPYYALVISLTSHSPFGFENLPRKLDHGAWEGTRTANFLDAVHYTDHALGLFVERLRREGILDDSILVVYGDHMGVARDSSNVGEVLAVDGSDAARWFEIERRVPGLIRLPGGKAAGEIDAVAGHLDFAPTVASLLGIEEEATVFFGRDLLGPSEPFVAFPNGSASSNDRLYLTADGGHGQAGCFSLPEREPLPGEECQPLADRALHELQVNWGMVRTDQVARVAKARKTPAVSHLDGI